MRNKVTTIEKAIEMVGSDTSIMIGGFGGVGTPYSLIAAMSEKNFDQLHGLHIISNDAGRDHCTGMADLVIPKRVAKLTSTYVNGNSQLSRWIQTAEIEVELIPMGTLIERIRAAGAGLSGVLTPTGVGTKAAENSRLVQVGGRDYLLAEPLFADVTMLRTRKADESGNLVLRRQQKNYNIAMSMAAKLVIVEAEEIVPTGSLDPDEISVPCVLVDYIVKI